MFSQRTLNVHDVRMLLHLALEVVTFAVNFCWIQKENSYIKYRHFFQTNVTILLHLREDEKIKKTLLAKSSDLSLKISSDKPYAGINGNCH